VGPLSCDCPDPVRPHVHNPNLIDVNAMKYNDTGIVVKKGDVIRVDLDPRGLISWGKAGTLFGPDLLSGPGGNAAVSPANHLLWIDPQMKGYPIGGVLGVIFPDDSAQPYRSERTTPSRKSTS
jgi:hypothetical protein